MPGARQRGRSCAIRSRSYQSRHAQIEHLGGDRAGTFGAGGRDTRFRGNVSEALVRRERGPAHKKLRRLGAPRRAQDMDDFVCTQARPQGTGPWMPIPGLWTPLYRRPPRDALGRRWRDEAGEPGPALPFPSPIGARGRIYRALSAGQTALLPRPEHEVTSRPAAPTPAPPPGAGRGVGRAEPLTSRRARPLHQRGPLQARGRHPYVRHHSGLRALDELALEESAPKQSALKKPAPDDESPPMP